MTAFCPSRTKRLAFIAVLAIGCAESTDLAKEVAELRKDVDSLKADLEAMRNPPAGAGVNVVPVQVPQPAAAADDEQNLPVILDSVRQSARYQALDPGLKKRLDYIAKRIEAGDVAELQKLRYTLLEHSSFFNQTRFWRWIGKGADAAGFKDIIPQLGQWYSPSEIAAKRLQFGISSIPDQTTMLAVFRELKTARIEDLSEQRRSFIQKHPDFFGE